MDTPDTPETPDTAHTPSDPETAGTDRAPTSRPWGRYAAVAGVATVAMVGSALAGAALVGGPRFAAVREAESAHDRGPVAMVQVRADGPRGRVGPAERRAFGAGREDAREDARAERLAAIAAELGLDADEVVDTLAALREELSAERAAARGELAEAHQDRVVDALVGLGADADTAAALVDQLHADAGQRRGPHRGGPRAPVGDA